MIDYFCMFDPQEGCSAWYFHIYIGLAHFRGFKILNFNILGGGGGGGGSEKWIYIWVWRFCGYFWGSTKTGQALGVISMHLRIFLKEWEYFLGLLRPKKRKCLVSGYPTDPNILGPTQTFLKTFRILKSIFRLFLRIFILFPYKKNLQKKSLPTYRP